MHTAQLPSLFVERLQDIVPAADFQQCLDSFSQAKDTSFRLLLHTQADERLLAPLIDAGLSVTPIPGLQRVYRVPAQQKSRLTRSTLFATGSLYIQNLSSMLPAPVLDPAPDEWIADLAAAPGGKTIHLAELLRNRGRISAVEQVRSRYYRLKANLEKHQVRNTRCYRKDSRWLWKQCAEMFDKILLDAPCSSEARFSTLQPETTAYWSIKKITAMARRQKQLLESAVRCLKPGGTLVYSTCSFAPEENEIVIQQLLDKTQGEVSIVPIDPQIALLRHFRLQPGLRRWQQQEFDPSLRHALRILPDRLVDGFFVCKLVKKT